MILPQEYHGHIRTEKPQPAWVALAINYLSLGLQPLELGLEVAYRKKLKGTCRGYNCGSGYQYAGEVWTECIEGGGTDWDHRHLARSSYSKALRKASKTKI